MKKKIRINRNGTTDDKLVLISRILDIRDYASGRQFPMWNDEDRLVLVKEELDKLANELNEDENLVIA